MFSWDSEEFSLCHSLWSLITTEKFVLNVNLSVVWSAFMYDTSTYSVEVYFSRTLVIRWIFQHEMTIIASPPITRCKRGRSKTMSIITIDVVFIAPVMLKIGKFSDLNLFVQSRYVFCNHEANTIVYRQNNSSVLIPISFHRCTWHLCQSWIYYNSKIFSLTIQDYFLISESQTSKSLPLDIPGEYHQIWMGLL